VRRRISSFSRPAGDLRVAAETDRSVRTQISVYDIVQADLVAVEDAEHHARLLGHAPKEEAKVDEEAKRRKTRAMFQRSVSRANIAAQAGMNFPQPSHTGRAAGRRLSTAFRPGAPPPMPRAPG